MSWDDPKTRRRVATLMARAQTLAEARMHDSHDLELVEDECRRAVNAMFGTSLSRGEIGAVLAVAEKQSDPRNHESAYCHLCRAELLGQMVTYCLAQQPT